MFRGLFDSKPSVRDARSIHVPVSTLRRHLDTDAEGVDTHDPYLDDPSNEVRIELSPLSQREFMDISTFYHCASNQSLDCVSRLNRSICP